VTILSHHLDPAQGDLPDLHNLVQAIHQGRHKGICPMDLILVFHPVLLP
jgi:hypothetical protein